jgi:hypothetical protein
MGLPYNDFFIKSLYGKKLKFIVSFFCPLVLPNVAKMKKCRLIIILNIKPITKFNAII